MTQVQERTTVQPAVMRSEQLVDRIGQNIGVFAALTLQRFQQTAMRAGEGLASMRTELMARSKVAQGQQPRQDGGETGRFIPSGGMPHADVQRAEEVVDAMGQRLTLMTSRTGFHIRRMAAYAREGAEDMLAEAQHIRGFHK